jgi:DNA-binding transcriptional LysR family regulator
MDRFEAMTFFVTAVEVGSFSAASRKLGVPLPTVSRKVADLEEHLSARPTLFPAGRSSIR